jgi:hypothetical protein
MDSQAMPEMLRVSVATYDQVIFPHPETGVTMLAMERKATVSKAGNVNVQAQPFGGGVRILDPAPLQRLIGDIEFDSERSRLSGDFRVLIPPSKWGTLKSYCLNHLNDPADTDLESTPDRELVEEFEETIRVDLTPGQYRYRRLGYVIEDHPVWTENWYASGQPTVRIYAVFEVRIDDAALCEALLAASLRHSDQDFAELARGEFRESGRGRMSTTLTLPLAQVQQTFVRLPPERRYAKVEVGQHRLDESVLAILMDVNIPQYKRLTNSEHWA